MMERITIWRERLCQNPRCYAGRIGHAPGMDQAEGAAGYTGWHPPEGAACPDCRGAGIVREIMTHEDYMAHIERQRDADTDTPGHFARAVIKWIASGRKPLDMIKEAPCDPR